MPEEPDPGTPILMGTGSTGSGIPGRPWSDFDPTMPEPVRPPQDLIGTDPSHDFDTPDIPGFRTIEFGSSGAAGMVAGSSGGGGMGVSEGSTGSGGTGLPPRGKIKTQIISTDTMSWDEYYSYQKGGKNWGGWGYGRSAERQYEHTKGVLRIDDQTIRTDGGVAVQYTGPTGVPDWVKYFKIGGYALIAIGVIGITGIMVGAALGSHWALGIVARSITADIIIQSLGLEGVYEEQFWVHSMKVYPRARVVLGSAEEVDLYSIRTRGVNGLMGHTHKSTGEFVPHPHTHYRIEHMDPFFEISKLPRRSTYSEMREVVQILIKNKFW